ncbi:MAG: hypothetical protein PUH81_04870 [Clostridiales bacterium]|nr:hypothetical protein [Eubacteriales bacterium]MDD7121997.1 hypothetical protein [Clostridiales bacterium]MDY5467584.1 hypothetical protein [Eubacteriales bacterium]
MSTTMISGIVVLSSFSDVLSILTVNVIVCRIVIVSVSFARIGFHLPSCAVRAVGSVLAYPHPRAVGFP